jgi:hypothetical protein
MHNLPCQINEFHLDKYFLDTAYSFSRCGRVVDALHCFCKAFMLRNNEMDTSQDWMTFFNVQFTMYLLGKRRLEVDLCEGDMVCDLIRDKWQQVRSDIQCSQLGLVRNLFEWSKSVEITFPLELDIFGDFDGFLGHDDSESDVYYKIG